MYDVRCKYLCTMYDVRCTIYVRFSLMYDLRVTFVLLLLRTSFVHRTFVLRTSRYDLRVTFVLLLLCTSFVHRTFVLRTSAQRLRLRVVRCHLQRPDVRLHRLLAAGGVLLRAVGSLVSGHLRGVFEAGVDSGGDGAEA